MKFKGKIQKLEAMDLLSVLAKALKKPVMYISIHIPVNRSSNRQRDIKKYGDLFDEVVLAAPYLSIADDSQIIADESGYIVFDKKEDMLKAFNATVGDEGPTETNKYNGSVKVYALTCNAQGEHENENT